MAIICAGELAIFRIWGVDASRVQIYYLAACFAMCSGGLAGS